MSVLLSPEKADFTENRKLLAWSVQAICFSWKFTFFKAEKAKKKYPLHHHKTEGKIVVYRAYFLKLLNYHKPLRDQLILELPTLNAFRTREVATLQREHVDLEKGDVAVLDSKKHVFITVPLDYTVAKHIEQFVIEMQITSGLLFTPGPQAGRRRSGHMTDNAIDYIWRKWCRLAGIPYMTPRYGRAYFAVDWHIIKKKSLMGLMDVLRHSSLTVTQHYLSKIRCYEDTKTEFYEGTESPFVSECARSDSCPLAAPNCYCKMFTPRLEVEAK